MNNSFRARSTLKVGDQSYEIWSLAALPQEKITRLPYSLRVLLENLLRHEDGVNVTRADIEALLAWDPAATPAHEIAFTPCVTPSCVSAAARSASTRSTRRSS